LKISDGKMNPEMYKESYDEEYNHS
jgi:hypothetical protein